MSNEIKPLTPEEVENIHKIYLQFLLQLQQERDQLKKLNNIKEALKLIGEIGDLERERDQLKAENKIMREALEFYGDPGRYMDNYKDGTPMVSDVANDDGEKAREALAQCDKMKGEE